MQRLLGAILLILGGVTPVAADVLAEIEARGEIRLGVRQQAAPFSYLGDGGRPSGLAVRLCEEVAREIAMGLGLGTDGLRIAYETVSSSERFVALAEGRTDLHCGPASATLPRRESLDFSILYYVDGAAVAARPGGYSEIFDTRKGDVGVLNGTTAIATATDLMTRNSVAGELKQFGSHGEGLKALAAGEIQLYVGDQAILLFQIEQLGLEEEVLVNEEVLSFEPYALAMRRGESALRLAVDKALSRIYYDGRVFDMIQQELGNYPISAEVRSVYEIVGLPE